MRSTLAPEPRSDCANAARGSPAPPTAARKMMTKETRRDMATCDERWPPEGTRISAPTRVRQSSSPTIGHASRFLLACRLPRSTSEAENQQGEHDGRDHDVHAIALQHESDEGGSDAGDRSRNQHQHPELHDRGTAKRERTADDAVHRPQVRGLTVELSVVDGSQSVLDEVERSADARDGRGDEDTGAEQRAEELVDLLVAPSRAGAARTLPRRHHTPPVRPLYNISSASTTTTTLNSRRRARVLAPARMRAPVSAPASTPSITGSASPGSM